MTHPSSDDRPTSPPTDEWDEFLGQLDQLRRSQFQTAPPPPAAAPGHYDVDAFDADLDRYAAGLEDEDDGPAAVSPLPDPEDDTGFGFGFDDEIEAADAAAEFRPPLGLVVPAAEDDAEAHTLHGDLNPAPAPVPMAAASDAEHDADAAERTRPAWPFALLLGLFALSVPAGAVLAVVFAPRFVPAPAVLAALYAPLPWWPRIPLWAALVAAAVLLVAVLFVACEGRNPRRRLGNALTWLLVFPFWLAVGSAATLLAPFGWSAAWTAQTGSPHPSLAAWLTPASWPASALCQRPALLRVDAHATPLCTDGFGPLADTSAGPVAVTLGGAATPAGVLVHSITRLCRDSSCPKQPAILRKAAYPAPPAPAEHRDGSRPL